MTTPFSDKVLRWFDKFGRHDLPWQKQKTAYRVWLSEIMLQQTQVKTVVDYFNRFITRFPNVQSLATAHSDEVLHLWAGLGYYARARNLHRAAQMIHDNYNGRFPSTLEQLLELPGIGRSTAGAIMAIAFAKKGIILDGNVKRVLSRVYAVTGSPLDKDFNDTLWTIAEKLTPNERVGDYTQAMMDLGATLCTRHQPRCGVCPLHSLCKAYSLDCVEDFPAKKIKKERPFRDVHLILLENNAQQILLHKRPDSGIWGGLWCLPEVTEKEKIELWCEQNTIKKYTLQKPLAPIKHILTHFTLQILIHPVKCNEGKRHKPAGTLGTWHALSALTSLGFPAPIQKLFKRYYHD